LAWRPTVVSVVSSVREPFESRASTVSDPPWSGVPDLPSSGPPVDIGLPAYRRPNFIREAIESVLAQTYTNWQLVVSENGPGGGEVEAVVRPYTSDPRIRSVATGRNLGPAANWTRLLQGGTAPYFTLIQDDDTWDRGFLARRVAFLEDHPECGFVYSGDRQIDQHGRTITVEQEPSIQSYNVADVIAEGVYSPRAYIDALYRYKLGGTRTPSICSVGVMSRRSALEAVGAVFDENYPFGWDIELYLRMALRFPTGFLAVRDGCQRIHHPSVTSETSFDGEFCIRYLEYHSEWFHRELPGLQLPHQYDEIFADACIMAALDALECGDRGKSARYLRGALRRRPSSIANPRVAASAAGVVLGRRGANLVARARAARRLRGGELSYEQ
jgi:glycosyltransferase involved in cell wall biosynthesis